MLLPGVISALSIEDKVLGWHVVESCPLWSQKKNGRILAKFKLRMSSSSLPGTHHYANTSPKITSPCNYTVIGLDHRSFIELLIPFQVVLHHVQRGLASETMFAVIHKRRLWDVQIVEGFLPPTQNSMITAFDRCPWRVSVTVDMMKITEVTFLLYIF